MARAKKNRDKKTGHGANLGFEEKLRQDADVARQGLTLGLILMEGDIFRAQLGAEEVIHAE